MKKLVERMLGMAGYRVVRSELLDEMVHRHHIGMAELDFQYVFREFFDASKVRCCVDVGANVGQTAKKFSQYFPNSKIHSVEPIRTTFEELERNTSGIENVQCHHLALGDFESPEYQIFHQTNSQWNSLVGSVNSGESSEFVRVTTLDQFCNDHAIDQISILKTDTEGFELEVFRGGKKMLADQKVDAIYVEVGFWESDKHLVDFFEMSKFMSSNGFAFSGLFEIGYGGKPFAIGHANAFYISKKYYS